MSIRCREAFKSGIEFDAPEGKMKVDPKEPAHLQAVHDGQDPRRQAVRHRLRDADMIEPDPYPEVAFPGWVRLDQGQAEGRERRRS